MDPALNPYAPGAGTQPPELTGRENLLETAQIALSRIRNGLATKSFILTGLRGVGKTVLLNRVEEMALDAKLQVFLVEAHEEKSLPKLLLPELRRILLTFDKGEKVEALVKRGIRVLKSFTRSVKVSWGEFEIGLDIDPEPGVADSGDLETDLPALFIALGEAARLRKTAIIILIDELQYLSEIEFSALIMALHKVAQKGLPILMTGAGLPQVIGLSGRSKSYAERLFDFPAIGPLSFDDARLALSEPAGRAGVTFQPDAIEAIYTQTRGYPYFLQEWGYQAWNLAPTTNIDAFVIEQATQTSLRRLDEGFFRVRFDRLTPREKDYMLAMAELGEGPHRSGEIAGKLKITMQRAAPVRASLISKGMIYSPAHGETGFTVPLFDAYLRRVGILKKN
ncbi:ATP-binding protein [Termitidicoccus mucosus]|uniref:AAA family ATPase n=1 Tax=Termitidicoccus mucosus TaxID=1184151 RepID=A0A178IP20_9BACT|nr:AAA family ATPase [Opitutaceae bacterium TSB47]